MDAAPINLRDFTQLDLCIKKVYVDIEVRSQYSPRTVRAVSPIRDFLSGAAVTRRERDERPYST